MKLLQNEEITFDRLAQHYIKLVSRNDLNVSLDVKIICLRTLRKYIEAANKKSFKASYEWEAEDWIEFSEDVRERQNKI